MATIFPRCLPRYYGRHCRRRRHREKKASRPCRLSSVNQREVGT